MMVHRQIDLERGSVIHIGWRRMLDHRAIVRLVDFVVVAAVVVIVVV